MVTSGNGQSARLSRRKYIAGLGMGILSGAAGCLGNGRPQVRLDSGSATLHAASERYIANGLQPNGDNHVFVTATGDESPELIGSAAKGTLADKLRNPGSDQFHIVIQLRSSPDGPMELWPSPGRAFEWPDQSTLRATVIVEPWGPFERIDDETERERIRRADELIFTAVWSLTPGLDELPDDVQLLLASRG